MKNNIVITLAALAIGVVVVLPIIGLAFGSIFVQLPVVILFCWFVYWASFNAIKEAKLFFWLWSVAVGLPMYFLGSTMEPDYAQKIYMIYGVMFFLASFVGGLVGIYNKEKKLKFFRIIPK